jgi:elongation factor G
LKTTSLARTRNIGFIAHIDAGKTTVTERVLYYSGGTHRLGNVDEGTTVTDWLEEEKKRGITITSAAVSCEWADHWINIIDTPGHVDFTAEVERSLRVLDGVVAVLCSVGGVEPQSESVWHRSSRYRIPAIFFVNKMDKLGADFDRVLEMIRERLHVMPLAVQMPLGTEADFDGVIDLIKMKSLRWTGEDLGATHVEDDVPAHVQEEARHKREQLLECVAERDEAFLEKYVEDTAAISASDIQAAIRRVTLKRAAVPTLCGSALRNKGIQPLLDAVVAYLPSPADVGDAGGQDPRTGKQVAIAPAVNDPLVALAFKVAIDENKRRLTYLKVYAGRLRSGAQVLNVTQGIAERIARIFRMQAGKRARLDRASTGDVVAVAGLARTITGDTLCDEERSVLLEAMEFPAPVISAAIEPRTKADQEKLDAALEKLVAEDPTFSVTEDAETGQKIISGMGELHLEILVERLRRDFGVSPRVGKPRVAYRETVTQTTEAHGHFDRDIGGKRNVARLLLRVEPLDPSRGWAHSSLVPADVVPRPFQEAVRLSLRDNMTAGPILGYPLLGLRTVLLEAEYAEGESTALAFGAAAALAFRDALQRGAPVLLEPLMSLEVVCPEEFTGPIIDNLNSRGGRIEKLERRDGARIIEAVAPLSKMFGYATDVRSLSQGRATYSMEFHQYAPAKDVPTW